MPRAKGNRTDLNGPKSLPVDMTMPDQAYGQRTSQEQSMRMVPASAPSAAAGPGTSSPPGTPTPQPPESRIGKLPFLEPPGHGLPVTHGMPYGPGAGPEALTGPAQQWYARKVSEQGTLQQLLSGLANRPDASTAVKMLAANAGAPQL